MGFLDDEIHEPKQWKKWASYVKEFHVESAPSEYNPHLYVSLVKGRYQLCTANAIYSFEDLYDNFSLAFNKIKLDEIPIKNVLVLGLGLGSIPIILERIHKKEYHYTLVEIDESVMYLAHKYGLNNINSSHETICADAHAFVMQCQQKFDMITMDVFLDDEIPHNFEDENYLERLKELLNPEGIILYNRLYHTPEDIKKTTAFYNNKFTNVFPEGGYVEVKGNWMLLNRKDIIK